MPAAAPPARSSGTSRNSFAFPGWYTADEVLTLHQRLTRSDGGAAERGRLLERVALDDARDRRVDGMSKGMQQRLGIAQALVGAAALLLLDEPTSALDPVGRRIVRVLLEELRGRGVSVLLNSHLLSEIELVCDRVAILSRGEVVAAGAPAELSRPRGVELETDEGTRTIEGATREDAPRLVAEAVAAGTAGVRRPGPHVDARGHVSRGRGGDGLVSVVLTIMGYGFREAVRRKVFAVVVLLTAAFLVLFWLATHYVFTRLSTIQPPADVRVDTRTFAGAFLLGLAMFATLFLGVVLAVFLTLGVVSGDAERGLLQPLVVRPVGRSTLLLSRFLGAAVVCIAYVLAVYGIALTIIDVAGNWTPPAPLVPGLELAFGVVIVIALSILGSVVLSSTANGIAVFMLFGAGLTAGLLGTIGHALSSPTIEHASKIAAWALPFEALYQDGLRLISSNASGLTGFLLQLGPFGGAYVHGWGIRVWAAGYLCVALALALVLFSRRDL